jgi:hypothetical protein
MASHETPTLGCPSKGEKLGLNQVVIHQPFDVFAISKGKCAGGIPVGADVCFVFKIPDAGIGDVLHQPSGILVVAVIGDDDFEIMESLIQA